MKRFGVLAAVLTVLLVPLFLFAGIAQAQGFKTGDNITVAKSETVDSTLWAAGRNIDISGTVDGDVWCAGQHVFISGTVRGDVLCAAQTIQIDGNVEGDIRVVAQTVRVGADVEGNLSAAAQTVNVSDGANVSGDMYAAATDVVLHGIIGRDAGLASENAVIGGSIGRDVTASVDNLALRRDAKISGDLKYTSNNLVNVERGADVAGEMTRTDAAQAEAEGNVFNYLFGVGVVAALYGLLSLLLLSVILILLFPGVFKEITDTALASPLKVFVVGLVSTLLFPFVFGFLMLTLAGIPLAMLLLFAWLLILMLSGPFFAYYFGRLIFKDQYHPVLMITASSLLLLVLFLIPFFNFLLMMIIVWMGVGMILTTLYTHRWHQPEQMFHVEENAKPSKTAAFKPVQNAPKQSARSSTGRNKKRTSSR